MTVRHALTIDVEDYFQVLNLAAQCPRERWDEFPLRCEASTHTLLDVLDAHGAKATFFCLGWIAERAPDLIREIAKRGHEIGSHGYDHQLVDALGHDGFRADLRKTNAILAELTGSPPVSFRACTWSIGRKTPWALPTLVEEGFLRDSSIYPVRHPDYGVPDAALEPHVLEPIPGRTLFELPPLTTEVFGARLPIGGGGYLRLFPVAWISRVLRKRERMGQPGCVYLHPWELDPGQPRFRVPGLRGFRHYVNLDKTKAKLEALLTRHVFTTFAEVQADVEARSRTSED